MKYILIGLTMIAVIEITALWAIFRRRSLQKTPITAPQDMNAFRTQVEMPNKKETDPRPLLFQLNPEALPDLYHCCWNATALYDVIQKFGLDIELPGFESCRRDLQAAIKKAEDVESKHPTCAACGCMMVPDGMCFVCTNCGEKSGKS